MMRNENEQRRNGENPERRSVNQERVDAILAKSTPRERRCRICEMLGFNVEEHTHEAIERLLKLQPKDACPKELFAERMAICDRCKDQDDTGVCMMCGCYVTVRGCLKSKHCPMKKW